jgi:O-antigen ligase
MSAGDAVTFLALGAAIPLVPWRNRSLRRVLTGLAFYLALLAIAVASHPTSRARNEWVHRAVIFGGAVLIGAAIAHRHQVRNALRAVVGAAALVSIAAVIDTVTSGFQAAYPFGMHKNGAGPMLAMVAIVLIAAPWRLEMRPIVIRHVRILVILGVFATQSRGAGLALVVAIAFYAVRHKQARQRAPIFFMTIALILVAVSVVTLQDQQENNPKFNGVTLRSNTIDDALHQVWEAHPFTGGGLKYFAAAYNTAGGAEQIFVAELSEAGIIGLFGLLVLLANTFFVLYRRRDALGEACFLAFVVEICYALTGIFWVAGTLTLPMLLVGLAVGEDGSTPSARTPVKPAHVEA